MTFWFCFHQNISCSERFTGNTTQSLTYIHSWDSAASMASSQQLEALMHGHAKVRKGRCDAGPSMTILQEFHCAVLGVRNKWRSWPRSCGVLVSKCCEDPDEILSEVLAWSRTGPWEEILWRSCRDPPQEDAMHWCLSESSSGVPLGSWMKIFWDPLYRRSFFDDLLHFSSVSWYEVLMSRHSVASCAKTSSRCCNYDNVQPDIVP